MKRARPRSTPILRILVGVFVASVLSGCEEDFGSDEWLVVDNRTGTEMFVTDEGDTGRSHLGRIGAGSRGFGAGAVGMCDPRPLAAHAGSPDGPVVARRSAADGKACVETWVITADDRGQAPHEASKSDGP